MRLTRKNLDLDKSIYFEATIFTLVLLCCLTLLVFDPAQRVSFGKAGRL